MRVSVKIQVSDGDLQSKLTTLFGSEKYREYGIRISDPEAVPDYKILTLPEEISKETIEETKNEVGNCKYIFVADGLPTGNQMEDIFESRDTLYLHNNKNKKINYTEIGERILDDLFLNEYLREKKSLFELIARNSNVAFSIIDRSYRSLYRNDSHKRLTHSSNCKGKLCWQAFHHYYDKNEPCVDCPSAVLFSANKNKLFSGNKFNKNIIPPPDYMVQRLGNAERQWHKVTCTRLAVSPIVHNTRKRIVGSIEHVNKVDVDRSISQPEQSILSVETIIEKGLRGIINEQCFTRARIFLYSKKYKSFYGYIERFLKNEDKNKEDEGKIKIDFKSIIIPEGKTSKELFDRGIAFRTIEDADFKKKEVIFSHYFGKNKAPTWLEILLTRGKKPIGKLVVDKFNKKDSSGKYEEVCKGEEESLWPYVAFFSKLLYETGPIKALEREKKLKKLKNEIIKNVSSKVSPGLKVHTLAEMLKEYFSCVKHVFIRFERNGFLWPAEINDDGKGIKIGKTKRDNMNIVNRVKVNQRKKISAIAYDMQNLVAAAEETNKEIKAKCSIPLKISENQTIVLALRGTKELIEKDTVECLREIAESVLSYEKHYSEHKKVLVLGNDGPEAKGASRTGILYDSVKNMGYDAILVRYQHRKSEMSNEDNVRRFLATADFVIIENTFPGGQIAEFLMCVYNRKITAVIYDEASGPSTKMLEGYREDHRFLKEFSYSHKNGINEDELHIEIEKATNKAVKWAKKLVKKRIAYYSELHFYEKEIDFRGVKYK